MKTMQIEKKPSYRRHVLATSISAISTLLVASSVAQASDIEIYQAAKSGTVTLMMVLDTSGSMGYPQLKEYGKNSTHCDLPNGAVYKGYSNELSINGTPKYSRYYCLATGSDRIYKFRSYTRKTGSGWNASTTRYYQTCITPQSNYEDCTWTTESKIAPQGLSANDISQVSIGSEVYYYSVAEEKFYDRITRLKDGMFDLLHGNTDKGIKALDDDKVIGLSTYSRPTNGSATTIPTAADNYRAYMRVPARPLGEKVNGITQRQLILNEVAVLGGNGGTPTAHAYADAAAYLMGTTTKDKDYSGFAYAKSGFTNGNNYIQPDSLKNMTAENSQCSGQGIYVLTDGEQNYNDNASGLMKTALDSNFSCTVGGTQNNATAWDCTNQFVTKLLNENQNPAGLKIKTAVVGFGSEFKDIPSFDRNLTAAQNIAKINSSDAKTVIKNTAKWGVNGEGGWYYGNESQDVVDSVNSFINSLSKTIPSVTTGSPTIPKDALYPAMLQNDAYYQQFSPTPDKSYQLWVGNLKKYLVDTNGILKGKDGNKIVDSDGKLLENYDFWATSIIPANKDADEDIIGSTKFALRGGVWSRLMLRTDPVSDPQSGTVQRKVLTNRDINSSGQVIESTSLRQVKLTDLTDTPYKNDRYRGYLVRLLGYNIDAANPPTDLDSLKSIAEFRQIGAVMHSYPVLLTNKGKLSFDTATKTMKATDREDYVLFGTTQGILHVVKAGESGKAGGGEEVFSFVPDEMVIMQRQAFEKPEATKGGVNSLFYGIDGAWTAYTEYVLDKDNSGNLTVGDGKGGQKGVQDVYGGLRMGGKSYYALDLRDMKNPKLKFHIDPSGNCSNSNPLGCMGQSWSKPSIGFVNWKGKRTRVMFVGGGYDMGYESTNYDQTNKVGAGVYMFRAEDEQGTGTTGKAGDLLWWGSANASDSTATTETGIIGRNHAEMKYSVVSEVRTVDRDGDDLVDHLYFGDLGGQIWRVDLDNSQKVIGNVVKKPVRLFNGYLASGKSPRFYDMPAFSLYSDSGNIIAVISQGSGNRSKPLLSDSTYNYDAIYNIYDKDVVSKDLYTIGSSLTKDIKPDNSVGLRLITDADRKDDTTLKARFSTNGWYYEFTNCITGKGACNTYTKQTEKVFGTPIALNNKLFVSTFDASKDGLAGDCGAGVKGASLMTTFCMPYGQCKVGDTTGTTRNIIGAGIHTITVGNDITDPNGGGTGGGGSGGGSDDEKKVASSQNYCVDTGGRTTITVTGGSSAGEKTRMCLIPQRWYPKLN